MFCICFKLLCNRSVSYEHYRKYPQCKIDNKSKSVSFKRIMDCETINILRKHRILPNSNDNVKPNNHIIFKTDTKKLKERTVKEFLSKCPRGEAFEMLKSVERLGCELDTEVLGLTMTF